MEDPAILRLNIERYQRLLEAETDPEKRQTLRALLHRMEAEVAAVAAPSEAESSPSGR